MASSTGPIPQSRELACARCGTTFTCDLTGTCWCAGEDVRLPMPASGDCLCPACLRAAAHAAPARNRD